MTRISRRQFINSSAMTGLAAAFPGLAFGKTPGQRKFVLVILRGAADGLAIAAPYGDGNYRRLRGELALPDPGTESGLLKLDGMFGLNSAMPELYNEYQDGRASILHAVASPYRSRSHFDGQDFLESGSSASKSHRDGWMNRALGASGSNTAAIAVAPHAPMVLRGQNPASNWAPSSLTLADEPTLHRIASMYGEDEFFSERLAQAMRAEDIADENVEMDGRRVRASSAAYIRQLMEAAAKFLTSQNGPNMAVVEAGGWDTHANQGSTGGTLFNRLSGLDSSLAYLRKGLGEAWADTVVTVVTEFGRTARVNGTRGTDHGTASAAIIVGGAVNGGRVLADWPGLRDNDLFEQRDLAPTTDIRSLFKAVLIEHLGCDSAHIDKIVFPHSASARPLESLIRAT